MHANHCPLGVPIQQLNVTYGFSPLLVFEVGSTSKDTSLFLTLRLHVRRQPSLGRRQCETKTSASGAKLYKIITQLHPQRRIQGKVIPLAPPLKSRVCHKLAGPKDKSKGQIRLWEWWRNQKVSNAVSKTHADSEVCPCVREISFKQSDTMALFRRSPQNFLPTYLWFFPPCSPSIISPPISRNIGAFKFAVVKILVLEAFKFTPTAANSSTKHSTIVARSLSLLAYSIKSSAKRTFANNSSSPQWNPQCWTRSFHFLIACSQPAFNNNGQRTFPCFTPRLIGNCFPCSNPTLSWMTCMLRMIVGPPSFVEWNAPWHEILHHWNGKAVALAQQHGLNPWSEQCLKHHWKFAMYVANLPSNRWVKRVLLWNPFGARTRGFPRHDWTSKLEAYTRFHQLGQWLSLAQDPALWIQLNDDFVKFCSTSWCFGLTLPAPQEGCLQTWRRKVKVKKLW